MAVAMCRLGGRAASDICPYEMQGCCALKEQCIHKDRLSIPERRGAAGPPVLLAAWLGPIGSTRL